MSVKLESGQWYRTRGGEIRYCIGESKAAILNGDKWIIENEEGRIDTFCPDGRWIPDETEDGDLIEHLPDCTGVDWEPPKPKPKYRPFANAEEFKPHRDRWIKYKQSYTGKTMLCVSFSNEGVTATVSFMPYRNAFDSLVFEDGSPFGVRVDE